MYLDETGVFHLVFQEIYKRFGFALTSELLFKHSFKKNVLKNFDDWLGLQTTARDISTPYLYGT